MESFGSSVCLVSPLTLSAATFNKTVSCKIDNNSSYNSNTKMIAPSPVSPASVASASRSPSPPQQHNVTTSRIRVANICCSGEERMIRSSLASVVGIHRIDVNIVGRYAVIQHCNCERCAPVARIVDVLNARKLGASIFETIQHEDNDTNSDQSSSVVAKYGPIVHSVMVGLLLVTGALMSHYQNHSPAIVDMVFVACIIVGGTPVCQEAITSLTRCHVDIHVLMLVATVGALASGDYVDAALLITLFCAAETIESVVLDRVRSAVDSVSANKLPKKAFLANTGKAVDASLLVIGDLICVKAGEIILADGQVISGEGVVDESALTGEACPVAKRFGDRVYSGTLLQNGYIEVKVDTALEDRTIQQLRRAVMDVQADKGEIGRLVDRLAVYWTPFVLIVAISVVLIGGIITNNWDKYYHEVNICFCSCYSICKY
jgi:Cd2+/Zn2+-exporting ATPase